MTLKKYISIVEKAAGRQINKYAKKQIRNKLNEAAVDKAVIVGAGISGCFLAYKLARDGYNVTVVEQAPAHYYQPECYEPVLTETLQQAGLYGEDSSAGWLVRLGNPFRMAIGENYYQFRKSAVLVSYRQFLRFLRQNADAAGVKFHYGVTAAGYENGMILAYNRNADVFRYPANLVIDASGLKGAIRQLKTGEKLLAAPLNLNEMQYVYRCIGAPRNDHSSVYKLTPHRQWLLDYGSRGGEQGFIAHYDKSDKISWTPFIDGRLGQSLLQYSYAGLACSQLTSNGLMTLAGCSGQTDPLAGLSIGPGLRSALTCFKTAAACLNKHSCSHADLSAYDHDYYAVSFQGGKHDALCLWLKMTADFTEGQWNKLAADQLVDESYLNGLIDPYLPFPALNFDGRVKEDETVKALAKANQNCLDLFNHDLTYPPTYNAEALAQWQKKRDGLWRKQ